ncbi:pyridine nucleotide-disulfide oxidoreductase domain-containing protein 1 [Hyalella azteca]|uniref:Pyridine nucleotide-disulfide oxidoreductase domain-containing protein 1 n=1 Tax=Hyalella azteca TaxID=294128 RepID=A0A8B7N0J8_HYAAZ|nr:pyridine nucleotide-disulfide oxidoreductase domain-containing protein 1 [Hyalella azteca]
MDEQIAEEHFTYAIIGGGIAGVTCAEHLEILDGEHRTALISGSDLIKAVTNVLHLTKSVDVFDVEDKHHSYLQQLCPSVTVKPFTVRTIQPKKKRILLSSGACITYDKLCVCTGASPKQLLPEHKHVLYIRDTESVQKFQQRIRNADRMVVVGNGGIATEMIYEISGVEIIWAVKDAWFTAAYIDPGAAEFFRPCLTKDKNPTEVPLVKRKKYTIDNLETTESGSREVAGGALGPDWHEGLDVAGALQRRTVQLVTKVEVVGLHEPQDLHQDPQLLAKLTLGLKKSSDGKEQPWPVYVELSNGLVYGCDFVVSAVGVTPNTSLLSAGDGFTLGADGGVCVGDRMDTAVPDVYAAGDVCTAAWPWAQHWHQMRLWTQARQMGSYAAKCMWASVTQQQIYQDFCFELFTHATRFFGHKVVMLGLYNGQKLDSKYDILLRMTPGLEYVKVVLKEGRMQGALLIGDTDLEETFENLILNQMDLSAYGEDLLDPDVDIEDYFD